MAGAVGGFSRGRLFHYTESKPWRRCGAARQCVLPAARNYPDTSHVSGVELVRLPTAGSAGLLGIEVKPWPGIPAGVEERRARTDVFSLFNESSNGRLQQTLRCCHR